MKSKKPVRSNEKQDMSKEEKFDLWIKEVDKQYSEYGTLYSLFDRCLSTGEELGLIKKSDHQDKEPVLYKKWAPFNPFRMKDIIKVFVFSVKHNISKLETIDFDLLYKNKERFGSWETALLITKAVLEDEAVVTK